MDCDITHQSLLRSRPGSEGGLIGQNHGAAAAHPVDFDPVQNGLGGGIAHHLADLDHGLGGLARGAEGGGERLPRRLRLREALEADVLVSRDLGQFAGLGHSLVQTAQLIDQTQAVRLGAGPDAALGDLADPLRRQLAAFGDAVDEVAVDAVHPAREGGALALIEGLRRREGVGVVAADRQTAHVDAEAAQGVGQHELAAEDADRAGQGRGLGHDPVGFRADPIAARRGVGAHGHDHRLARRLGRAHGGQDLFRSFGRAARRGDAEDDGLHVLVLDCVIDGLGGVVRTNVGAAAEGRIVGAATGHDGALAADDGDGRLGRARARRRARPLQRGVVAELDDLGVLARLGLGCRFGLFDLTDLVDQLQRQGLIGGVRAGLDDGLQGVRRRLAVAGDVGDGVVVDGAHPGQHGLAVRRGVVAVEVRVDRVLELVALLVVGLDAVLLEGAAQEDAVRRQTDGLEARRVLQPQLIGAGGDHIAGHHRAHRHEALAVGDDRLARGAEAGDRLTHLIGRGGRHAGFGRAHQQDLDVVVGRRLGQDVHNLNHRHAGAAEGREGIGRRLVRQPAAQVELQHRMGGRRRLGGASRHGEEDQRHDGQDDEKGHKPGEDAQHGEEELLHGKADVQDRGQKRPGVRIEAASAPSNEWTVINP
uniref:PE-PGRS family protein n=1 Tax=Parastrongyloides trichosuri TaxID=131310 RepID=A0A0N4Z2W0_PARTI